MSLTKEQCLKFVNNDSVNPITNRTIQRGKATWNKFVQQCNTQGIQLKTRSKPVKAKTLRDVSKPTRGKVKVVTIDTKKKTSKYPTSIDQVCAAFAKDDNINPRTGRVISKSSRTYKELVKECTEYKARMAQQYSEPQEPTLPQVQVQRVHRVRLSDSTYPVVIIKHEPFIREYVKHFTSDIQQPLTSELTHIFKYGRSVLAHIPVEPYNRALYHITMYYILAKYILAYDFQLYDKTQAQYQITTDTLTVAKQQGVPITKQQLLECEQLVFPLLLPYLSTQTQRKLWFRM